MGIDVAEIVRDLRNRRGWSQETLSKFAHVPIEVVTRLEEGAEDVGIGDVQSVLYALSMELRVAPRGFRPLSDIESSGYSLEGTNMFELFERERQRFHGSV